jgi:hypothetical protein
MPDTITVVKKVNGFIFVGKHADPKIPDKEIVVEGSDPRKLGAVVLAMFKTPRKPRTKKET